MELAQKKKKPKYGSTQGNVVKGQGYIPKIVSLISQGEQKLFL